MSRTWEAFLKKAAQLAPKADKGNPASGPFALARLGWRKTGRGDDGLRNFLAHARTIAGDRCRHWRDCGLAGGRGRHRFGASVLLPVRAVGFCVRPSDAGLHWHVGGDHRCHLGSVGVAAQQEGRCGLGCLNLVGAVFGVGVVDRGYGGLLPVDDIFEGHFRLFGHGGGAIYGLWPCGLALGRANAHPTCAWG